MTAPSVLSTVAAEFDQDSQEGGLADRLAKIEEPRNSRKPTYANTNLYGPAVRPVETQVTTYYLELLSVEGLNPFGPELPDLEIREAKIASPELGRFFTRRWDGLGGGPTG